MPRPNEVKYVYKKAVKISEFDDEMRNHINNQTPVSAAIGVTLTGLFVNPIIGCTLGLVSLTMIINDYLQDQLVLKFNSFMDELLDKPSNTKVYLGTKYVYKRKGSQGSFWVGTGDVKFSFNASDFEQAD